MTLYFAYGSNMNVGQMRSRCPAAELAGTAALADHAVALNSGGHATVVPVPGQVVLGGLWRLTPACRDSLDRYEGVATGHYDPVDMVIRDTNDNPLTALVYVATDADGHPASAAYTDTVLDGAADLGLPAEWIDRLAAVLDGRSPRT